MRRLLLVILVSQLTTNMFGQIVDGSLEVHFANISEDYQVKFNNYKNDFVSAINNQELPRELGNVELWISYSDGVGYITASFVYDHSKLFVEGSSYKGHYNEWRNVAGVGNSVLLQSKIFGALANYKYKLALAYGEEFIQLVSVVRFIKSNNDWLEIYAYNQVGSYGDISGSMYSNVIFEVDGKKYNIESANYRTFNQAYYFVCENIESMDGKKNGYFYFLKFFDLEE